MKAYVVRRTAASLFLAAALGTSGSAMAEGDYSDAKLEAFAVAAVELQRLSSEWRQKIEGAETETQASEMRDQAGQELVAAVKETEGISLEEYNEITESARQDPELASRIRELLIQKQQE